MGCVYRGLTRSPTYRRRPPPSHPASTLACVYNVLQPLRSADSASHNTRYRKHNLHVRNPARYTCMCRDRKLQAAILNVVMSAGKRSCPDLSVICYLLSTRVRDQGRPGGARRLSRTLRTHGHPHAPTHTKHPWWVASVPSPPGPFPLSALALPRGRASSRAARAGRPPEGGPSRR